MCANRDTLQKLQLIQNVGCRAILLAGKRTHISDMHKTLGLLPLDERRDLHLTQLCHKNIYPEKPQSLTKYFTCTDAMGRRRTRGTVSHSMKVPNLKTDKGRLAFAYIAPRHWNNLDNDLRVIDKFPAFQQELMKRSSLELDNHPT